MNIFLHKQYVRRLLQPSSTVYVWISVPKMRFPTSTYALQVAPAIPLRPSHLTSVDKIATMRLTEKAALAAIVLAAWPVSIVSLPMLGVLLVRWLHAYFLMLKKEDIGPK